MTTPITPTMLLVKSLKLVESKSIRAWAVTPHNYPLWREIAETAVKNGKTDPSLFAAYIVAVAMGM